MSDWFRILFVLVSGALGAGGLLLLVYELGRAREKREWLRRKRRLAVVRTTVWGGNVDTDQVA